MNFHNLTIQSCLKQLKTSFNGLTSQEVKKRLNKYGLNKLEEEKPIGWVIIFFKQFQSPLIYILLAASLITFLMHHYIDASVILGAVVLNTIIGFFQENKVNKSLNKLKKIVEHKALVIRNNKKIKIDSSALTIGDIIVLQAGNRVPADARIIESIDLQIIEASLTGESIPSVKTVNKIAKGAPIADRENMVYAGTIIVRGSGRAVVTAIGRSTEIGKIAQLIKTTEEEKTPLQLRLLDISKFLGTLVLIICAFIIGIGIWQGRDVFEMFIMAIAIAVAAIPEGLTVAVTVILVFGMQKILKQKALTRRLVAAETLGSTTVICADKTGTLTEGKMTVSHIIIGEKEFEIKSFGSRQDNAEAKNVSLALQTGMMCSNAVIENPEDELHKWRIVGMPTETALLSAAAQSGLNKTNLLKIEPKISELPFSSESKFMATIHQTKAKNYVLYEKGAPEKLLDKAENFYHKGKLCKLTKNEKTKLTKIYEKLTNKGLRVIGVATRELHSKDMRFITGKTGSVKIDWNAIDKNLTFIGFIALKDPLRPEARETIKTCCLAGIRPVIITGDHKLTAMAIAKEVGLNIELKNIVTGEMLDKIDDKKLKQIVNSINLYARVSPHHKLRIVQALQSCGEVVAMTGDGINDSPALKAADIGISLGTGTDIAKEASDLVLLDNNFKTIVSAVQQGRIIFSNIRKVIAYLLIDSFSEVVLITGSILFNMPMALLPAQILWINIVNDGLPNFSLAFEKGEKDIMRERPIKKNEPIINKEIKTIIFSIGVSYNLLVFGFFYYLLKNDFDIAYIRTVIFAIIGLDSLIYIFSLRSFNKPIWKINPFSNPYLIGAVIISLGMLLSAIYLPPLQLILSTTPLLGFNIWIIIILIGIINTVIIEAVKYLFAKRTLMD
ncbi:MAG: HAD-IC family P-type ATPase [Patescibacteria group bacterium]